MVDDAHQAAALRRREAWEEAKGSAPTAESLGCTRPRYGHSWACPVHTVGTLAWDLHERSQGEPTVAVQLERIADLMELDMVLKGISGEKATGKGETFHRRANELSEKLWPT